MPTSSDSSTSTVDRDAVFALLTAEIEDLRAAQNLRGWTPWVLFGALVSGAWLLLQAMWEAGALTIPALASAVFTGALLLLARPVVKLLRSRSNPSGRQAFSFVHTSWRATEAVLVLLCMVAMSAACIALAPHSNGPVLTVAAIWYGLLALAAAATFLIVVFRIPMPTPFAPVIRDVKGGLVSLVFFGVAGTLATTLFRDILAVEATIDDVRVGGLIVLLVVLLILLDATAGRSTALVGDLAELRRRLMLGELGVEEARQQARTALQGMWLSDVAESDMRRLLGYISDVRSLYDEAARRVDVLRSSVPLHDLAPTHVSQLAKVAFSSSLDSLVSFRQRVQSIATQYWKAKHSLLNRLEIAARLAPTVKDEHSEIVTELERAQAVVDSAQHRFVTDFRELVEVWNRWYPSEARATSLTPDLVREAERGDPNRLGG